MFRTSINIDKYAGSVDVGRNVGINRNGKFTANSGNITLESESGNVIVSNGNTNLILSENNLELVGNIKFLKGTVFQTTALANDVFLSKSSGVIKTVNSTLFPKSTAFFTLFNNYIKSDSVVMCGISGYSGNEGIPFCYVDDIVEGSCDIMVSNLHKELELNGFMNISFIIF